jgi:Putative DNA-binding domain
MLFSKPISDLTFEDVEEFCKRFKENMRVEYKSTFDDNVKRKLPKVLSSFANSYGGILIIGINAPAGAPQEPFDGIVFPEKERSRLGPVRTPKPSSQCNQHNQEREENNSYAGPALGISFGGHSEGKKCNRSGPHSAEFIQSQYLPGDPSLHELDFVADAGQGFPCRSSE